MKRQRTYFKKLFLNYSAAVLVVLFLLSLFAFYLLYREQYQRNLETHSQLVTKTQEQIDASLQNIDRMINGLLFDKDFLAIMEDENAEQFYNSYSSQVLNSLMALDAPLFSSHRLIAFNRDLYYTFSKTGENEPYIKEAISTYPWWGAVIEAEGNKVILPIHADSFDPAGTPVYSVARAIVDEGEFYGIVEVQNNYRQLEQYCSLDESTGKIAVFSADGDIVYPRTAQDEEAELLPTLWQQVEAQSSRYGNLRNNGTQITYSRSEYSGYTTILYASATQMNPLAIEFIALFAIVFLLLTVIFLLLLQVITKRLTAPLIDLNRALSEVSLNNLSLVLPDSHGITEIDTINHSFETMFHELKRAISQSVQSRANEERANYLALESQMNPHTLYNTINMIEAVSYMNGDKEVSALCISFSQMLRYISDYTERPYTVRDELQHLNNYAALITKRYDGKLDILVDNAPQLDNTNLPKFTIQPLVENAVKHGFGGSCQHLTIQVLVKEQNDGWFILVKDSGQGFTTDRLEEIDRQFARCDEALEANENFINRKIGNLALANIYIRCRIMYGTGFHIDVGNNTDDTGGYVKLTFFKDKEVES